MRIVSTIALIAAGAATTGCAAQMQQQRQIGVETSIAFADRHELRDWEAGPTRDVLYVRDYQDNWYRVQLSGLCVDDITGLDIAYTTSPAGSFDRFSKVYDTDSPDRTCGVVSIKTSLPPPERRPDESGE